MTDNIRSNTSNNKLKSTKTNNNIVSIKLEFNQEHVLIHKENNTYKITNIKQWIFLTKFKKAYLIINYPYGTIETLIEQKFVYNQDYELLNDLDFNYRFIFPLGNDITTKNIYLYNVSPFTGTLNGNNYIIKNINIIDCENNGLFGVVRSGTIKNLTLQNVVIKNGIINGSLIGKASHVELLNIKIIGNILISGINSAGFIGMLEGNCKNIHLCIDGQIEGENISIVTTNYYGTIENMSIISKLKNNLSCFDIINGKLANSNFISFTSVSNPFYNSSQYHQIHNVYYFQLNNEKLPELQQLNNSYYRNLSDIIFSNMSSLNWYKINDNYYLKHIINYSNDNIELDNQIQFYDIKSGKTNIDNTNDYFNYSSESKSDTDTNIIETFNKEEILLKCKKMENIYNKELECNRRLSEINYNNENIKISHIINQMENNLIIDLDHESLEEEINSINYQDYMCDDIDDVSITDSNDYNNETKNYDYMSQKNNKNLKLLESDQETINKARQMILSELNKLTL